MKYAVDLTAHATAFLVVAIWGSTFVFTKLLLAEGLSPAHIFTLRFVMAYVLLLAVCHRRWFCQTWRDEALMVVLGVTGGSVYFLTENLALAYTTATNTSLIVCTCPLFTLLLTALTFRSERVSRLQALGSLLAFVGMAAVVLNGRFVLHLSPRGDVLAFTACLCWAVYSVVMKWVMPRYSTMFITRKVFFYGLLTIVPYYVVVPDLPSASLLLRPQVLFNLVFLGVVASMLCFLLWNWAMRRLGAVVATNWIYFNPLVTIFFAWSILHEQITPWFLLGTALILVGIYLCDRRA